MEKKGLDVWGQSVCQETFTLHLKLEMRPCVENDNVGDGLGNVERIWKGWEVYCADSASTCLLWNHGSVWHGLAGDVPWFAQEGANGHYHVGITVSLSKALLFGGYCNPNIRACLLKEAYNYAHSQNITKDIYSLYTVWFQWKFMGESLPISMLI